MANFTNTSNCSTDEFHSDFGYKRYINILLLFLRILTCSFIVVGNGVTVVVLVKQSPLRAQTNRILVSLTLADLLVGVSMIWDLIYQEFFNYLALDQSCCSVVVLMHYHIMDSPLICSVSNILVVTVDRYVAIIKPLHYNLILTPPRVTYILIAAWTIPIAYTSTYYLWWFKGDTDVVPLYYRLPLNLTCFCLVGIILLYVNIRVQLIAKKHMKRAQQQRQQHTYLNNNALTNNTRNNTNNMLIYVILAYFLSWLPLLVILGISSLFYMHMSYNTNYVLFILIEFAQLVGYANSGWNFLIYIQRSKTIREAYKKVVCRHQNKREINNIYVSTK